MALEVGKAGKVRFIKFIKKTNMFECGNNGVVVERENGVITVYATNNRCSEIYAKVALGGNELLKYKNFLVIAYSENIMLVDAGQVMVVIDFGEKKVAVNKPELEVIGKKDWAENVRMDWTENHDIMFGLKPAKKDMDMEAAAEFWKWFLYNELEIIEKVSAGGTEAQYIIGRIDAKLCPVFPYEDPKDIEFQLGCNGDSKEFFLYHFNRDKLKADMEKLGEMKPHQLSDWELIFEA